MGEFEGGVRGVDWASDIFCHGQKRDYLSRASQRTRGATKIGILGQTLKYG